jgi:hypothetical protein
MLKAIHSCMIRCVCIPGLMFPVLMEVSAQPIRVDGGNVTMTITTGTAGGQLLNVVNITTSLSYQKQSVTSKITVRTVCLGQSFNLILAATNVTAGVAAPDVALMNGNPAIDFIRDIPKTGARNATCLLQYTASATFAQGNSTELNNDVHTITFTIQSQ